jgi:hypothetical protein
MRVSLALAIKRSYWKSTFPASSSCVTTRHTAPHPVLTAVSVIYQGYTEITVVPTAKDLATLHLHSKHCGSPPLSLRHVVRLLTNLQSSSMSPLEAPVLRRFSGTLPPT